VKASEDCAIMIPRIISTGVPQISRQSGRRLRDFGVVESGT
jgi:hypothetical protein